MVRKAKEGARYTAQFRLLSYKVQMYSANRVTSLRATKQLMIDGAMALVVPVLGGTNPRILAIYCQSRPSLRLYTHTYWFCVRALWRKDGIDPELLKIPCPQTRRLHAQDVHLVQRQKAVEFGFGCQPSFLQHDEIILGRRKCPSRRRFPRR